MTKLTLNRIHQLADPGSFVPYKNDEGAGFHLGRITVGDRPAYIVAMDVDKPMQISPFESITRKVEFIESIHNDPAPLVLMLDTPAHMKELKGKTPIPPDAIHLLADSRGVGRTYAALARLEGVVPRISILFGPVAAALSFPATLTDATVMTEQAALCIGRPDAVSLMTGQPTSFEALGGAEMHYRQSGMAHALCKTDAGALTWARQWLGYWPDHTQGPLHHSPPTSPAGNINEIGPAIEDTGLNTPISMADVLTSVADSGSWLEMGAGHAGEVMTGFCRIKGAPIAVVANNSMLRGGILHPETCRKMARFITTCGRFKLPVAFLADTPGFMVGEAVEHEGNVQAASDLYTAIATSPSPKVCVVVRKAYSAGLYAMAGASFDAEFWAMPNASISVFGPEALKRFSEDRDMPPPSRKAAESMLAGSQNPSILQEQGLIDQIVQWKDLRGQLSRFARGEAQP